MKTSKEFSSFETAHLQKISAKHTRAQKIAREKQEKVNQSATNSINKKRG